MPPAKFGKCLVVARLCGPEQIIIGSDKVVRNVFAFLDGRLVA
jgi:hypothetical protein